MARPIFWFFVLLFPVSLPGQNELPIRYDNFIYEDYIRSVQFHLAGDPLSDPFIHINEDDRLVLRFDDLNGDVRDYFYTIIHCDMDWTSSNLNEMEYIDGFFEERINDYEFSFKTFSNYTNYQLQLPNNSMSFTKTGNYILAVYEKNGDKFPILTRRFVVYDSKVALDARFVRPNKINKLRTHQEIDFNLFYETFPLRNPQQEIRAVVLQNGRWDNAITGISPFFIRNKQLVFDYQDKIVFPAGREFRFVDLRSLRFRSWNVASIEARNDGYDVILNRDEKRTNKPYTQFEDLNGKFTIESQDKGDPFLSAEYADVLFSYSTDNPFYDDDLYLLGAFNDWRPTEEYRMVYNDAINGYVLKVPLKQGYYNYAYGLVSRSEEQPSFDWSETEGDWHETENNYTILIYYRAFGARYDQVIGYSRMNSLGRDR